MSRKLMKSELAHAMFDSGRRIAEIASALDVPQGKVTEWLCGPYASDAICTCGHMRCEHARLLPAVCAAGHKASKADVSAGNDIASLTFGCTCTAFVPQVVATQVLANQMGQTECLRRYQLAQRLGLEFWVYPFQDRCLVRQHNTVRVATCEEIALWETLEELASIVDRQKETRDEEQPNVD